jgi:hypothetical protein
MPSPLYLQLQLQAAKNEICHALLTLARPGDPDEINSGKFHVCGYVIKNC